MYQSVSFSDFCDSFKKIRPENFSNDGLRLLFDHFEEIEDSTGEKIELDVIGICCEYSEDTFDQIRSSYSLGDMSDEEVGEWISGNSPSYVGMVENGLVYCSNF